MHKCMYVYVYIYIYIDLYIEREMYVAVLVGQAQQDEERAAELRGLGNQQLWLQCKCIGCLQLLWSSLV